MSFTDNLYRGISPDPFVPTDPRAIQQTTRREAAWTILVNGLDVTQKMNPHLISARVTDKSHAGEAEIELDDREGNLPIPPLGANLKVIVAWKNESGRLAFSGPIRDIEYSAARGQGGGRRMFIHAFGVDTASNLKEPQQEQTGEGAEPGQKEGSKIPFMDHISKVWGNAGGSMSVHPQIAQKMRDYWSQNAESAIQHAQNFANEFGGILHITDGNKGEIVMPGESVVGSINDAVVAEWGANLISCRVRPLSTQDLWAGANQQHYDTQAANWLMTAAQNNMPQGLQQAFGAVASWMPHGAGSSESASGQQSGGAAGDGGYPGAGRIVINGEPLAAWNHFTMLIGVRPGVDGLYLNIAVENEWSRTTGFITTCEVVSLASKAYQQSALNGLLDPNYKPTWPIPPTPPQPAVPQLPPLPPGVGGR